MFKVYNKNTGTTSIRRSGVFIVNFEHISHLFLVFLLLILNKSILAGLNLFCNSFHVSVRFLSPENIWKPLGVFFDVCRGFKREHWNEIG